MKKRMMALVLSCLLSVSLVIPAAAAGAFSDVSEDAWYYGDVQDVQQYGIIEGIGRNRFLPNGKLTCAQAITMAARTYAYTRNEEIPDTGGSKWYDRYLDYALEKDLVYELDLPMNIDTPCDRDFMARMFYGIVEGGNNPILNDIQEIPDIDNNTSGAPIYALYRFGILTGSDKYGAFYPTRSITRAETAAILNRVLNQDKRKSFVLPPFSPLHYVDLTKVWEFNTQHTEWYEGEEYTLYDDTVIAFRPNGTFCAEYNEHDGIDGGLDVALGTYSVSGHELSLVVHHPNSDRVYTVSYQIDNNSAYNTPGFNLIQQDNEHLFCFNAEDPNMAFYESDYFGYNAEEFYQMCLEEYESFENWGM